MRPLEELRDQIRHLPAKYKNNLLATLDRVEDVDRRRRHITNLVQEAITQLRLDMKYLMFDLECTRRERDNARSLGS